MLFEAGFGVELPKPGRRSKPHLWIAVTDPAGDPPETVIVNITTRGPSPTDTTVVIEPGDHAYISRPSVVYYKDAQLADAEAFYLSSRQRAHRAFPNCPEDTLRRIQDGLLASPHTPNKVKRYCRDLWGVDE